MSHVYKIALLMIFVCGCSSTDKDPSTALDFKIPQGNWTEGERTTDGAPESGEFKVAFETTAGNFTMLVHRDWAPRGAERFYQLIKNKYYDGAPFYRVVPGFMVQFGMNADPKGTRYWDKTFPDDPVKQGNIPGLVSYAMSGPNSRSTQLFINYGENARMLDPQGFAPFAEVVEGMDNVIGINSEYSQDPKQDLMARSGNKYVFSNFPKIDYIKTATLVEDATDATDANAETKPDQK